MSLREMSSSVMMLIKTLWIRQGSAENRGGMKETQAMDEETESKREAEKEGVRYAWRGEATAEMSP